MVLGRGDRDSHKSLVDRSVAGALILSLCPVAGNLISLSFLWIGLLLQRMADPGTASPELIEAEQAMYAPFFGSLGVTFAMIFTAAGSAYGTAKSGTGIASMAVARPDLVMKAIIPVVMAGIVAIYGLVVAVILSGKVSAGGKDYTIDMAFAHLAAGLTCGLCGLGAGYAIGIVGDAGVRGLAQQPRLFVGMILILIFSEVCPPHVSPPFNQG